MALKTTLYRSLDTSFRANAAGIIPPVPAGLIGWWDFWGDVAASLKNMAWGTGQTLAETGTVVFTDDYASLDGDVNFFTSNVLDAGGDITILSVCRPTGVSFVGGSNQPMIISNFGSGSMGASIWAVNATASPPVARMRLGLTFDAGGGSPASVNASLDVDATNLFFVAGRYSSADDEMLIRSYTHETEATVTEDRDRLASTATFMIGDSPGGSFSGTSDVMTAAIYNRALSDEELETMYAFCQARCARRGVTI